MVELIARTHAQRFDAFAVRSYCGRSGAYLLSTSVLISAIAEASAIFRNSFNNLILSTSTSRIAQNLKGEANVRRQRSRIRTAILRCKSVESVSAVAVVTELDFSVHFGGYGSMSKQFKICLAKMMHIRSRRAHLFTDNYCRPPRHVTDNRQCRRLLLLLRIL